MYRARDEVENEEWLARLRQAAESLDLSPEARSNATDLFLSGVPEADRSKPAMAAASLYAGALIAGDERPQTAVADAMDVTRLSVQQHWKDVLEDAGFRPPTW
ncbi:transcription initiation factor IIB family protein [Halobaculum marinum]|uniref:Transcription initiation factor IIB family protein n=1 Tax=Halobaculum marinum TaxID=3031996 RepID=A0ABD5WXZ8_9EURY|nr:transcription initiation factor IIB family protein [Halobaculum sp. DT55]